MNVVQIAGAVSGNNNVRISEKESPEGIILVWENKPKEVILRDNSVENNQSDWTTLKNQLDNSDPNWNVEKKKIPAGDFRKLLSANLQIDLDESAQTDPVARTIVSYAQTYKSDITFGSETTAGMVMYLAGEIPIKGSYMQDPILTTQQASDWLAWKEVS